MRGEARLVRAAKLNRPDPSEYAPYYERYIGLVPAEPIVGLLESQGRDTVAFLRTIPEAKGNDRYAPGKWSINEVVGHLTDAERVFSYRALRFARNDASALAGFEQDDYVRDGGFESRTLRHLTDEFEAVRRATVLLFESIDEKASLRKGTASGNPVSVRAIAHIIAGHERHHAAILNERYLARAGAGQRR